MGRKQIYDSPHQGIMINNWKRYGLICREGETYKDIYSYVMSIDNCELCNIKFNKEVHNEKRCMDHDHKTGYFRQVLCMKCNSGFDRQDNKSGHPWISIIKTKRKSGKIYETFHYKRAGFKRKASVSLTKLIAYSFIQLLKKPI